MSFPELFALAVALAMDAFAVSVCSGCALKRVTTAHFLRLSLTFGFFQFLMPVIGWTLGLTVRGFIETWDHWLAFALLAWIGGNMLRGGGEEEACTVDPTRGGRLFVLAVATSIDALAVGVSMAFMSVHILASAAVIGVVAFALSVTGGLVGRRLGCLFQRRAELTGGLVLIAIGVKILIEHLSGG